MNAKGLRRLFMVMCLQQRPELQLVPFLLTTIDLMRIIKQNALGGDYLDGYLRSVYGPRSRRYLFLKQAMMERRLVLFLDGMDEVPTGLKSMLGLSRCVRLRVLDLSFNALAQIEGLDALGDLRELKLYANEIVHIDGLSSCLATRLFDLRRLDSVDAGEHDVC